MTVHPLGLIIGWILDKLLGDPLWLPHPVVGFGKMIAVGEKKTQQRKPSSDERWHYGCFSYHSYTI